MIKTFSSRAGRLSDTNKKFLKIDSKSILKLGQKPKSTKPIVMDVGFGDAQSFVYDVMENKDYVCLLYTSPSPRDLSTSRMPSSA